MSVCVRHVVVRFALSVFVICPLCVRCGTANDGLIHRVWLCPHTIRRANKIRMGKLTQSGRERARAKDGGTIQEAKHGEESQRGTNLETQYSIENATRAGKLDSHQGTAQ